MAFSTLGNPSQILLPIIQFFPPWSFLLYPSCPPHACVFCVLFLSVTYWSFHWTRSSTSRDQVFKKNKKLLKQVSKSSVHAHTTFFNYHNVPIYQQWKIYQCDDIFSISNRADNRDIAQPEWMFIQIWQGYDLDIFHCNRSLYVRCMSWQIRTNFQHLLSFSQQSEETRLRETLPVYDAKRFLKIEPVLRYCAKLEKKKNWTEVGGGGGGGECE